MRPDVLVQETGLNRCRLAVDAKYKRIDLGKASASDIYQAFLYAHAFGKQDLCGRPVSVVVYPVDRTGIREERLEIGPPAGAAGAELVPVGIPSESCAT